MTNSEFLKTIAERTGVNPSIVEGVIEEAKSIICEEVGSNGYVKLARFGTFLPRKQVSPRVVGSGTDGTVTKQKMKFIQNRNITDILACARDRKLSNS